MLRHMLCSPFLVLGVLLTTLVGLDHGQETSPPPAAAVDSGPTLRLAPGSPAPEFALESVNGESVRLSDFHGQAVLTPLGNMVRPVQNYHALVGGLAE